jgi:hypothetical protein
VAQRAGPEPRLCALGRAAAYEGIGHGSIFAQPAPAVGAGPR